MTSTMQQHMIPAHAQILAFLDPFLTSDIMRLAPELMYTIADHCVLNELEENHVLLRSRGAEKSSTLSLLLTNQALYEHISSSHNLRRLRLWRTLLRIPQQFEPLCLIVGPEHDTSVLQVDLQTERVDACGTNETFLVLTQLRAPRRTPRRPRRCTDKSQIQLPYSDAITFLDDLCAFARLNVLSMWLWTSSAPMFLRDAALTQVGFRTMVNLPQKKWMIWDRPTPECRRFSEDMIRHNVESFGKLLA